MFKRILFTSINLIFYLEIVLCQNPIEINGKVIFDVENKFNQEGINVYLSVGEKILISKTKEDGRFHFKFATNEKKGFLCVEDVRKNASQDYVGCGYCTCSNVISNDRFDSLELNKNKILIDIHISTIVKNYCNFNFNKRVLFDKNSIKVLEEIDSSPFKFSLDSALSFLIRKIEKDSSLILLIEGNSDYDEKKPREIASKRADIVFKKAVSLGLDRNRIEVVINSNKKNLFDKMKVNSETSKSEKNKMKALNRRVTFDLFYDSKTKH